MLFWRETETKTHHIFKLTVQMSKKLFRSQVHCIRQSDSKTKSRKVPETNKKW